MAQSAESPPTTETKIDKLARETYFRQPDMIEFLLAENLALKSILHEKGVITPEEFAAHKQTAFKILSSKVDRHIEEWKKAHPEVVRLYEEATQQALQNPQQRLCPPQQSASQDASAGS